MVKEEQWVVESGLSCMHDKHDKHLDFRGCRACTTNLGPSWHKLAPPSRALQRARQQREPDPIWSPCDRVRMRHVLDVGGAVPMWSVCTRTLTVGIQYKLAVLMKILCSLFILLLLLLVVILAPPIQAALHFMFQAMSNTKRVPATVPNTPATVASSR